MAADWKPARGRKPSYRVDRGAGDNGARLAGAGTQRKRGYSRGAKPLPGNAKIPKQAALAGGGDDRERKRHRVWRGVWVLPIMSRV